MKKMSVQEAAKMAKKTPGYKKHGNEWKKTLSIFQKGIVTTTKVKVNGDEYEIVIYEGENNTEKRVVELSRQQGIEENIIKIFREAGDCDWKYKPYPYKRACDICADAPTGVPLIASLLDLDGEETNIWRLWDFFYPERKKCPHYLIWAESAEMKTGQLILKARPGLPVSLSYAIDMDTDGFHLSLETQSL